jgi:hypothetical protein
MWYFNFELLRKGGECMTCKPGHVATKKTAKKPVTKKKK